MSRSLGRDKEIERSIIKTYRKDLWGSFIRGVEKYQLIKDNDKIAVCISGGKDSMLLAMLMKAYCEYVNKSVSVIFLSMDPGYTKNNKDKLKANAKLLNIPLTTFSTNIFEAVEENGQSPCFICARMRRGYLYRKAKELGCNKIALGHHYDDVVETILMSMLYGAQIQTMLPKLKSDNVEGMELIRPMYLIKEQDIIAWQNYNQLEFLKCACTVTQRLSIGEFASKRAEIKELIKLLKENYEHVDENIFGSVENINLKKIMGYQRDGKHISFLDEY